MKIADARTKKLIVLLDTIIKDLDEAVTQVPTDLPPKCWKCGQVKSYDLFKGEYCNRCNDWC